MKKYYFSLIVILAIWTTGCSKSDDSPVANETKGSISGVIKEASTNQPVAGLQVLNNQSNTSTITDNTGSFSFQKVADGTYTITVSDPGYKTCTISNVTVSNGNSATANATIKAITWKNKNAAEGAVIVLPLTVNPSIKGVPLSTGDLVGCFYDSLGSVACSGFTAWDAAKNLGVTIWGDDALTSQDKEGFTSGETLKWKVKRASDGKVFDATATYSGGKSTYSANGTFEITAFTITAN